MTMMTRAHRDSACLDEDDVAAFLQSRLDAVSTRALEQHVAVCRECRVWLSALADSGMPEAAEMSSGSSDSRRSAPEPVDFSTVVMKRAPCHGPDAMVPGTTLGAYRLLNK